MLLEHNFDCSGFKKQSFEEVALRGDAIVPEHDAFSHPPAATKRHVIHIVAEEAQQRAMMARLVFATGNHAEVYSDVSELIEHKPTGGIVLAHESEDLGAGVVCRQLNASGLWLPVVGFGHDVDASRIVAGMKAGAHDFLIGDISPEALLTKVRECAADAEALAEVHTRRANARMIMARLSDRERQVVDLVAVGMSNKAIARELGISPRTVEIHRMKGMAKLGATSSAHAIRMWLDARES